MPPTEQGLTEGEREDLMARAEAALDEGRPDLAMGILTDLLARDPRDGDAIFLLAECYREQAQAQRALDTYRRAVLVSPENSDAWTGLGTMQLLLLQESEAPRALNRALREDPGNAEAWFTRALVRERIGDFAGADRDMVRAHRLDPTSFPLPVPLTDEDLQQVLEEAMQRLQPSLQSYLANVAILVDEVPSKDVLQQYDPPIGPSEILGYFSGYSLLERSLDNPWSNLPSAIILFRRNLQRYARNHDHLVEELKITLYHEVGHFLGLDEDDLKERGLE